MYYKSGESEIENEKPIHSLQVSAKEQCNGLITTAHL